MAKRYQFRIGVQSELFFSLILNDRNPTSEQLALAVADVLRRSADDEGGIKNLEELPEASLYPDWISVDPEIQPTEILAPAVVRIVDCVEINSGQ